MTKAEAMSLLQLVVTFPGELDASQHSALIKVTEYCRRFLRGVSAGPERDLEADTDYHHR